jgi:hypothetical protein
LKLSSFPIVKVPKDRDAFGSRGPLPVNELVPYLVNSISFVAFRDSLKSISVFEFFNPLVNKATDSAESFLDRARCTSYGYR